MFKRILTYSLLSLVALSGFFGNIHIEMIWSNDKIVSISYTEQHTYAAGSGPSSSDGMINGLDASAYETKDAKATSTDQLKMWNSLIDGLNIILGIITAIVSPAIMFAWWLMSPDWTSGDLFGLRTPMYSLWVTVSNIVYFVYAILLILIALGTMFGKESFSYKVMLPKLALGILMVPFTWWFVQWTVSLASVVTASVITIPAETMANLDKDGKSWMSTPSIPREITINDNSFKKNSSLDTSKTICDGQKEGGNCIAPIDVINKSAGMYGYMMIYAYSVFRFQEVKNLPQGLDIISTGLGIVHQWIVAAIMFVVFGLLTLALVAMLLVRAIKLWVYAIFSPLFTFQFVAGSAMMWGDKDTFTIKEFVGLCFVPAIVGLALSFWLILINAVGSDKAGATTTPCTSDMIKGEWCKIISIAGNSENSITRKIVKFGEPEAKTLNIIKFGGVQTTFEWKAGAAIDPATEAAWASGTMSVLNSAGGIFGTLIIDIIALVFIWMAFMAAKNVSKAVAMAVEPFEKIGSQVWSLAKSIPKYTPIPGLGMSMSGMEKGIGKVEQGYKDHRTNEDAKSPLGQLLGLEAAARKETVKAIEAIRTTNIPTDTMVGNLRTQLSQESKWNKMDKTAEWLNTILEKYWKKGADWKITWSNEADLKSNMVALWVKDITSDLPKIKAAYEKWMISKKYFEDSHEGQYLYKQIHPTASTGWAQKTTTEQANNESGGSTNTESTTQNPTTPPPKK